VLPTAAFVLVPLASGPTVLVVALLAAAKAFDGLTGTVANHSADPGERVVNVQVVII
jgi:hypothetical protein